LSQYIELIFYGLNPLYPDSINDPDLDHLTNLLEQSEGTSPIDVDTDRDHLLDGYGIKFGISIFTIGLVITIITFYTRKTRKS